MSLKIILLKLLSHLPGTNELTHWAERLIYASVRLPIIGSDNGLSPDRRQAIIWSNADVLQIGPLGAKFNKIWKKIITFSFKKMRLKMSSSKWRPFCLGLNVLMYRCIYGNRETMIIWWPFRALKLPKRINADRTLGHTPISGVKDL